MSSSTIRSSAFICRSCTRHLRPLPASTSRTFSTSSSSLMPSSSSPYSPHYIDIPFPPQRYAVYQPRAKGKRPVPRNIFPKKNGLGEKKITPEYLALVSKEPSNASNPGKDAPATEKAYIDWKTRMAASRRKNIREGLLELHAQTKERENIIAERSTRKQQRREQLLAEEDPEDVKLTTPTLLSALRTKTTLADPGREERLAEKRAKYEAWEQTRVDKRQEDLHELYIRCHEFVFSEKQLDIVIDYQFNNLPSEDYLQPPPPDTRMYIGKTNKELWEDATHLNDERIIEMFADALTGGAKRDARSMKDIMHKDQPLTPDVLQSQFPHSSFGYPGAEGKGEEGAQVKDAKTSFPDVFQLFPDDKP